MTPQIEAIHPIPQQLGNYTYIRWLAARTLSGTRYLVLVYGAYNAFGLIGRRAERHRRAQRHHQVGGARRPRPESIGYYGASARQVREFERLLALPDAEFRAFLTTHPRRR
jgi:hypothetical protein